MFFFIFFDISSLLLRYITPAIPRSSRLDLSKNILKNIDSYLNFRTLGSRDSASHEQVLNHQNIRKPPGKSYSNPNPHTGRSRYVPSVLVSPSHTQTQTRTEHPMTLSVTPVCVLCTLVVGGRDYCVYLMTIWREAWFQ